MYASFPTLAHALFSLSGCLLVFLGLALISFYEFADEVISNLNTVRNEFPHASVFASTYEAFVDDLEDARYICRLFCILCTCLALAVSARVPLLTFFSSFFRQI